MKNFQPLFVPVVCLMFSGCAGSADSVAPDPEQVKREIRGLNNAFAEVINARDTEGILEFYAEDFISMPPGEPMIRDRAAFRESTNAFWPTDTATAFISFETIDILTTGDLVVETGREKVTQASGEVYYVHYLVVWRRMEKGYKIIREIYHGAGELE